MRLLLLIATCLNLVNSQRFTQAVFGNIPPLQLPTSQGRNYEVTEDGKGIFRESIGNQLRFGLNQRLGQPKDFINDESFEKFASSVRNSKPALGFGLPIRRQQEFNDARQPRRYLPQEQVYQQQLQQQQQQQQQPINHERQQQESKLIYSPSYRHQNHAIGGPMNPNQESVYSQYTPRQAESIYSPTFAHRNIQPLQQPFFRGWYQQPAIRGFQGFNQGYYDGENQNIGGSAYNQAGEAQGVEASAGAKKLDEGIQYLKQDQGNSGLYSNQEAKKEAVEDSKKYGGSKLLKKEGLNEDEQKNRSSHKKGHVIKSFKNSHHKDETGNDEQYYDEAHDEGGTFKLDSTKGKFGESEASSHEGLRQNKELEVHEKVDQGEHKNAEYKGENSEHSGKYDEKKFIADHAAHGNENLHDEQSLLEHRESERVLQEQPSPAFDKDT